MRRLALCWVTALAACTQTPQEELRAACDVLCSCTVAPLPGLQAQCTTDCMSQAGSGSLPTACEECILEHSNRCSSLTTDCQPLCQVAQPDGENP